MPPTGSPIATEAVVVPPEELAAKPLPPWRRASRFVLRALPWVPASVATLWAYGALHFDFPVLGPAVAGAYMLVVAAVLLVAKKPGRRLASVCAMFLLVLVWWSSQRPRNDRPWQDDVAALALADIDGDHVTLHNVRNIDYTTETEFNVRWETRTVDLSQITGIDLFITYWGSPWMAHPILSFQFADADPICFSIETRKELGEGYSALAGLYRRYELIYLVADERDVIRLRANYREGESVYLYRSAGSASMARERFLEYVGAVNALRETPRWYNAITTNCTTSIRAQHPRSERLPWDWRILANGKADEMLYERQQIATDGLSFEELKQGALINDAARSADQSPDFWRLIRDGRPGFGAPAQAVGEDVRN